MFSHNLKLFTCFFLILLVGACVGGQPPEPSSVTVASDHKAVTELSSWIDSYLSSQKIGDPVQIIEVVTFDRDLFDSLYSAEITSFTFRINEDFSYVISREYVFEYDGGWILGGTILGHNDTSEASIHVLDDGSTAGSLFVQGVGQFIIKSTNKHPYHVVYLRTGSYNID